MWKDKGDGYSPPPLLLAAGARSTALDWSLCGFKGCRVIILDGSGSAGMGKQTLDYLKNEYGATVLKVPAGDEKARHCASVEYHTGEAASAYSEYESTRHVGIKLSNAVTRAR